MILKVLTIYYKHRRGGFCKRFRLKIEAYLKAGWQVHYIKQSDIFVEDGVVSCVSQTLELHDNNERWFTKLQSHNQPMGDLDCVLMRKDPPFDMEYIYSTYLLELAEQQGCLVLKNRYIFHKNGNKLLILHS